MPLFPFHSTCWFLTGPTAGGKTAAGIELARRLNAEIISLDSMAVYRGMDIGTAKPTAAEQAAVPHHLIDIIDPQDEFSLAQYLAAAEQLVGDIQRRGHQVLFVGGTPLYLKGLLRGIFEGPPADWEYRQQLQAQAAQAEPDWMHAQLQAVDPIAAAKLHPRDERRLIRALEVHAKTGRPISAWQAQFDIGRPAAECRVFVLEWDRATLYDRINRRVEAMFAAGLVAEVEGLLAAGVQFGRTASQAVGYREVLEHLRGERDLPGTVELVQMRTRQFAKRQLTWFRSLSECRTVPVHADLTAAAVASLIYDAG